MRRNGELILAPVLPNRSVEAQYRRGLDDEIKIMCAEVEETLARAYRRHSPVLLAQDAAPADALQEAIERLKERWRKRFDKLSEELAKYFATAASKRSDARLRRLLKEGGISVEFHITPGMRDVMKATVHENVSLIKSIPQRYLQEVEGAVMRSVQAGRDLGPLAHYLVKERGVTKRRAAFIARDQNNKATAMFTRVRQTELGIKEAVWRHSHGGNTPRPTHVKMDGKKYEIAKGMYDSAVGEHVLPGQLPNCRCTSRSVIPGFA